MKIDHPLARSLMLAVFAGLFVSACETTAPAPNRSGAAAEATTSSAPDGRRIYYGRCTPCHAADPVKDYTRSEWREIVADMAGRAKLSGPERSAVLAYVLANAADS
jgi:cytochrome c5